MWACRVVGSMQCNWCREHQAFILFLQATLALICSTMTEIERNNKFEEKVWRGLWHQMSQFALRHMCLAQMLTAFLMARFSFDSHREAQVKKLRKDKCCRCQSWLFGYCQHTPRVICCKLLVTADLTKARREKRNLVQRLDTLIGTCVCQAFIPCCEIPHNI